VLNNQKFFGSFFQKRTACLILYYSKLSDCILDAPHAAGAVHRHDVEANAGASPMRIFAEQNFRGAGQSCLLTRLQRGGRISQLPPRLYLDEDSKPVAFRYCIDFTGGRAHAAPEYIETITGQRVACELLGNAAGFEMCHAAILAWDECTMDFGIWSVVEKG